MYHQQKFYKLILFRQANHLYKSEIKEVLEQILVECPNEFFSIQMFDHFKQLFVHDFGDGFWVAKVIHPQHWILKMRPLSQTLSNALEMSRKTHLTSTTELLLTAVCMSYIIDSKWAILESPGRKPDWEGMKSLLIRK